MSLVKTQLAAIGLILGMTLSAPTTAGGDESSAVAFMQSPGWLGQKYLGEREWAKLDELIEKLAASGEWADALSRA